MYLLEKCFYVICSDLVLIKEKKNISKYSLYAALKIDKKINNSKIKKKKQKLILKNIKIPNNFNYLFYSYY